MRAFARGIVAIWVSIGAAQTARAQGSAALPPVSSAPLCDLHALTPPSYLTCGLYLNQGRIRRGADGEEIARPSGFSPMPLTEMVRGDSAMHYAEKYENYTWVSSAFKGAGLAAIVVASQLGRAPGCEWPVCAIGNTHTSRTVATSGFVVFAFSTTFQGMAREAATRALWWHNAWLGR